MLWCWWCVRSPLPMTLTVCHLGWRFAFVPSAGGVFHEAAAGERIPTRCSTSLADPARQPPRMAAEIQQSFRPVLADSDIVLVDQRGTGELGS